MAQNDSNPNPQDQGTDRQNEKRSEDDLTRESRTSSDPQDDQQSQDSSNRQGGSDIGDDSEDRDEIDEDRDDDLRTAGGSDRRGR